jgi:ketosteroid isomerase-like protein
MQQAATNRELVAGAYAALAAGDVKAFLAVLDEAIVLREPACLPYGGVARGLPEVMAMFGRAAPYLDSAGLEVEEVIDQGDRVAAVIRVPLRDRDADARVLELWRLRDGRVVELEAFWSDPTIATAGALDALDLADGNEAPAMPAERARGIFRSQEDQKIPRSRSGTRRARRPPTGAASSG